MELMFSIPLILIFLYLNIRIISSDIRLKKIPNRYLLYLLYLVPFWYIVLFIFSDYFLQWVIIWKVIFEICFTTIVAFLLFHFWKWWAWDAKYLLILGLFIPFVWIGLFGMSIALITILYMLLYFFYFWFGANMWQTNKRKSLYKNLWKIYKDKIDISRKNSEKKDILIKALKAINIFFVFFISLRFIRIHIMEYIGENPEKLLQINIPPIYIFLGILGIILAISIGIRFIVIYWKNKLEAKRPLLSILFINLLCITYLSYEYIRDTISFIENIILIFTLYLIIYCIVKLLLFSYKLVFVYQEEMLIDIKDLKAGMIIDCKSLYQNMKDLHHAPKEVFAVHPYLDEETKDIIQNAYKQINTHNTSKQEDMKYIKIKKYFSFGIFIFLGFLLSIVIHINKESIYILISNTIKNII